MYTVTVLKHAKNVRCVMVVLKKIENTIKNYAQQNSTASNAKH